MRNDSARVNQLIISMGVQSVTAVLKTIVSFFFFPPHPTLHFSINICEVTRTASKECLHFVVVGHRFRVRAPAMIEFFGDGLQYSDVTTDVCR